MHVSHVVVVVVVVVAIAAMTIVMTITNADFCFFVSYIGVVVTFLYHPQAVILVLYLFSTVVKHSRYLLLFSISYRFL